MGLGADVLWFTSQTAMCSMLSSPPNACCQAAPPHLWRVEQRFGHAVSHQATHQDVRPAGAEGHRQEREAGGRMELGTRPSPSAFSPPSSQAACAAQRGACNHPTAHLNSTSCAAMRDRVTGARCVSTATGTAAVPAVMCASSSSRTAEKEQEAGNNVAQNAGPAGNKQQIGHEK